VSAVEQRLRLKIGSGSSLLPGRNLVIRLELVLTGTSDKVTFDGWSGSSFGDARHKPALTDNLGDEYKVLDVGAGKEVADQERQLAIYPKLFANDFVIFEAPKTEAAFVNLALPAAAFGGTGTLRFQIPKSMIEVRDPEPSSDPLIKQRRSS
jgi:hypothetical protein